MFPGAVLVCLESEWTQPIERANVLCLSLPATVLGIRKLADQVRAALPTWQQAFAADKPRLDREVRQLLLGPAPAVGTVPCGPYRPLR